MITMLQYLQKQRESKGEIDMVAKVYYFDYKSKAEYCVVGYGESELEAFKDAEERIMEECDNCSITHYEYIYNFSC